MALLQAGLGMMGGTSQHAMANIGAGGAQGLAALAQAKAARTAEENALLSGRLGLEKIGATRDYQDAAMQMRRDLQKDVLAQRDAASKLSASEKSENRLLREKKEWADQLESMRKDATTRLLAKMKGAVMPEQQTLIEAQALESLKSDPDYIDLYKKVYGRAPRGAGSGTMSTERAGQFKVER